MIKKEEYALKIANADKAQLVAIHFELIADYLKEAKENSGNEKIFMLNIHRSRELLKEMKLSLNMEYEISAEYYKAYTFIDKMIAKYLFCGDEQYFNAAFELLEKFRKAWENVDEKTEPVMENTETMYAGLTYGKDGQLNEYVDIQENRGFKA